MAKVQLANVTVLDNPTAFMNPFQFEITFDCQEDLADGEKKGYISAFSHSDTLFQ